MYTYVTVVHLQNDDIEKKLDHDMFLLKYSFKLQKNLSKGYLSKAV